MSKRIQAAVAALVLAIALGLYGVLEFAHAEKERDLQTLQTQLSIVADSRAASLQEWLEAQYAVLSALAQNESLQIYIRVLGMSGSEGLSEDDPAQLDYLRNLLLSTARQHGFLPAAEPTQAPANVRATVPAGIALLTPDETMIAATPGMPPVRDRLLELLAAQPATERGFLDLLQGPDKQSALGFAVPVFGQPGDGSMPEVIARALGLRLADHDFFATLQQPGSTARTAETYLARRAGNTVEYLTPLRGGATSLPRRLAINGPRLIDAEALSEPGRFHRGLDYGSHEVLAISREIVGTDWVLVHKIDEAEAMAASEIRRATIISVLVTMLALVAAALIVAWRASTSVRAEEAARQYRLAAERFESLSKLLDVVMNSQPQAIVVTDSEHTVTYANRRAAQIADLPEAEAKGHSLIGLLGHDKGASYNAVNDAVLASSEPRQETTVFVADDGTEQTWRSYHCHIHLPESGEPAVLTSVEDITAAVQERARRERNTRQLIDTLVGLVDERDPDSASQSRHAALVARTIAEEMGLSPDMVETTEQAARLANIGKIRIPRSLLRKQGALTPEELRLIKDSLEAGPSVLRDIEFDGPVVPTLEQINERYDGSGRPLGLTGDQILPSAQAVAVANSFVALLCERAFRKGKSFEEAEALLLDETGQRFDRRPVLSLLNFLNNKGGKAAWADMQHARDEETR